jgi:DNA-directed RNA polymerase III subunit RPC4
MMFRPNRPPPRVIQIKEDPDGPNASASGSSSSAFPPASTTTGLAPRPPPRPRKPMQRKQIEMTASGPFSLGTGATRTRDAGKTRAISVRGDVNQRSSLIAVKNESSSSRSDYREPDKADRREREEYSDQEDDIQIVDMGDVGNMDILAPTALPRMKGKAEKKGKRGGAVRVKRDISATRENGVDIEDGGIELETVEKDEPTKNADALDLSASEDEEIMDDLLDDFVGDDEDNDPENRLYLFQFPPLFPTFTLPSEAAAPPAATIVRKRSVAFAEDTVGGGGATGASKDPEIKEEAVPQDAAAERTASSKQRPPEGQIGRLDVFRDGRVQFRFNDIVMEVTGGSQSSFLQQVMILNGEEKKATTLGELHRKFVVAPEIESMLNDVDIASHTSGHGE